jgi:hypothetical protein
VAKPALLIALCEIRKPPSGGLCLLVPELTKPTGRVHVFIKKHFFHFSSAVARRRKDENIRHRAKRKDIYSLNFLHCDGTECEFEKALITDKSFGSLTEE